MVRITGLAVAALALLAAGTGCTRHVHHHHPAPKKVVVLEREHDDPEIVVVHRRPGPNRVCWKHRSHWHCRR